MTAPLASGPVLVGVIEGQRPEVLRTAEGIAAGLGASLLLVTVAADPYLVGDYIDPMTGGIPLGLVPQRAAETPPEVDQRLRDEIEAQLASSTVPWTLRTVEGEPALALADAAEKSDARMIVVGTRDAGVLASIAEFLSGSVAAHLAHRQHRPVLVVPRADRDPARPAPWDLPE
ncbi:MULTISPECIES: universal stress protein [unclassified Rathayibacter]|uniref:universal stress protein n=1 Tax=unclassified Rathayibacter TaxID=2609250 RepID=UPI00188D9E51|nr:MULTISPECIES: universal stress protein [unclassified Rathayibacter]MBF4461244.1 universal stress protein [Rathayibacter sp. VKM Ac-2879]MBF4502655.1 universal stress protein [Rathayibacter sp. VKM Ac-2878]